MDESGVQRLRQRRKIVDDLGTPSNLLNEPLNERSSYEGRQRVLELGAATPWLSAPLRRVGRGYGDSER